MTSDQNIHTVAPVSYSAVSATGPDYDEVEEELKTTEKSSEKEAKSTGLTKSSNYYFTLTEHPPKEEHESNSNV